MWQSEQQRSLYCVPLNTAEKPEGSKEEQRMQGGEKNIVGGSAELLPNTCQQNDRWLGSSHNYYDNNDAKSKSKLAEGHFQSTGEMFQSHPKQSVFITGDWIFFKFSWMLYLF